MGRALGVDLGSKRIGFALSDPDRIIASAYKVVECQNDGHIRNTIIKLCKESDADLVVLGYPLNMDGSVGPAAQRAEQFQEVLKEKLDLPVELCDERLTTKSAHDVLIEAGTRREKRKHLVDMIAAQMILQHYLDSNPA